MKTLRSLLSQGLPGFVRILPVLLLASLLGCSDVPTGSGEAPPTEPLASGCDLDRSFLAIGARRDEIPALTNPEMSTADNPHGLAYLAPDDRVISFEVAGRAFAIPHNILWWHEIVNLDVAAQSLAVTYCPLTGSSMVFERGAVGNAEFGVSGLLYKSNLVMFARDGSDDLLPQMLGERRCTDGGGTDGSSSHPELGRWPSGEMTWAAWRERHPEGLVVTSNTGWDRAYGQDSSPYIHYASLNAPYEYPMPPVDSHRPPKERVLGAPPTSTDPGIAFPFGVLSGLPGPHAVMEFEYDGKPALLLWSDTAEGGGIFRPETLTGKRVTLEATEEGIVDAESGSRWWIEGRSVDGALEGERLLPVRKAYVAYWGAWAAFFSETRLGLGP